MYIFKGIWWVCVCVGVCLWMIRHCAPPTLFFFFFFCYSGCLLTLCLCCPPTASNNPSSRSDTRRGLREHHLSLSHEWVYFYGHRAFLETKISALHKSLPLFIHEYEQDWWYFSNTGLRGVQTASVFAKQSAEIWNDFFKKWQHSEPSLKPHFKTETTWEIVRLKCPRITDIHELGITM